MRRRSPAWWERARSGNSPRGQSGAAGLQCRPAPGSPQSLEAGMPGTAPEDRGTATAGSIQREPAAPLQPGGANDGIVHRGPPGWLLLRRPARQRARAAPFELAWQRETALRRRARPGQRVGRGCILPGRSGRTGPASGPARRNVRRDPLRDTQPHRSAEGPRHSAGGSLRRPHQKGGQKGRSGCQGQTTTKPPFGGGATLMRGEKQEHRRQREAGRNGGGRVESGRPHNNGSQKNRAASNQCQGGSRIERECESSGNPPPIRSRKTGAPRQAPQSPKPPISPQAARQPAQPLRPLISAAGKAGPC